jgi:methionyl aminopeptidase
VIHYRKGKEIEQARAAGHLAAKILQLTAREVKAGVSTLAVDQAAAAFMADHKCRSAFLGYRQFPGHICISLNDEVVHGIGRAGRMIHEGDIVKIDVGIVYDGWIGDNALTVPVGEVSDEKMALLQATEDSLDAAVRAAYSGRALRDLCGSVEKAVVARGFSVVKEFVGHGVGKQLHEEPQVPNWADPMVRGKLKPGMILAVEPMVNVGRPGVRVLSDKWTAITVDGRPSAHFEHMILITEGEPEILTPRARLTQPYAA